MAISRAHTWSAGEVLTAIDLNAEFNNLLNNASDLVSPFTKAISMGGFALNFDAANTIALTATTSGIVLTGGTLREPSEDSLTAHAGGGQGSATALSVAKKFHRISTCASTGDSYALPASTAGQCHYVRNDGAAAGRAFGTSPDTINGVATATGIPHPVGVGIWYVCTTAGNWTTGPLVAVSGNFSVTFTATAATNVTLPTSGTLATLAGSESLTNKTITVKDANFTLQDDGDVTKQAQFQLSGITAGNTRTLTIPDTSDTIVVLAASQVLTTKTFDVANNTLNMHQVTNSLSGDVNLNNAANYFDGPSIGQGTSGTWFASGTVTVHDTAGAATFSAKLWDGTTVIASARVNSNGASTPRAIALSGYLATPAANIRISVKDETSTSGLILFNNSGNSKDSTVSAIRIA